MSRDIIPDVPSRLTLTNNYSQLAELGDWLQRIASSSGLPAQAVFRLDLVLTEAVTNVMDHAHRLGLAGRIELACSILEDRILVEVIDDGLPFDPTARAPVILPSSLEEARPGGLGIHLMRQYTTDMAYRRESDRNILCMTLPLERQASSA